MPNWVLDVSKSVVESLAIDDSELPALDIDPSAMPSSNMRASVFGLEWEDHNREDREDNYVKTMAIDSQTYDSKQHHQERIVWSYHVFDPVLGVIPRETRDLWTQCNKTFLDNESNPMLFADETTDEDNSTAAGGFKIQRSLPPVRFS